jgi:hypothetical protein
MSDGAIAGCRVGKSYGDENHDTVTLNFHPFFIPLNQLFEAILDLGFWIADLLYRFALSFFIKWTEYLKSEIQNL